MRREIKNFDWLTFGLLFFLTLAVVEWLGATDKKAGLADSMTLGESPDNASKKNDSSKILKDIYAEIKEFKAYPGESFVQADFFVGSDDDDDTYKDVHVSILIHDQPSAEKMKIQMTVMEARPGQPRVKYARESKTIVCLVLPGSQDKPKVLSSDLDEKDIGPFLASLLGAIQKKKALLSLGGSGRRG